MYPDHYPYFFRKSLLQELNILLKEAFALTRTHRFREITNIQTPFIHTNYAEISNVGDAIIATKYNMYLKITNLKSVLRKNFKKLKLNNDKIWRELNRFREINEFKFSMRNVYKYMKKFIKICF